MNWHDLPPPVVHDFLAANGRVPPMKNRIQIKLILRLIEIIYSDLRIAGSFDDLSEPANHN